MNFFQSLLKITDITVWQGAILDTIFIPLVIFTLIKARSYYFSKMPANRLLIGIIKPEKKILIFTSQLSSLSTQNTLNPNPIYGALEIIIPTKDYSFRSKDYMETLDSLGCNP